jgi:hypothetical protein
MREYVFLLEYDYGVHPVRDVFIDHPDVVASTLDISISHDTGWRVERVTGPEHALDELESVYLDEHTDDRTSLSPACDSTLEYHETLDYQVLEREPTARTIYRHETDMSYCRSLGYLALKSLGDGLTFDATQRGSYYEWRVLVPTERDIDAFHRTLREELPAGVSLTVRRVGTPERWLHAKQPRPARRVRAWTRLSPQTGTQRLYLPRIEDVLWNPRSDSHQSTIQKRFKRYMSRTSGTPLFRSS